MHLSCPLKDNPEWILLKEEVGTDKAHNLWNYYDGHVPKELYVNLEKIPIDGSNLRYKILNKSFGSPKFVEKMVRIFSINLKRGKGELYYPTINEVRQFFAKHKNNIVQYIGEILQNFPDISAKGLGRILNTVVHTHGNDYKVTTGWINNGSSLGKTIVEKEFFEVNLRIAKELSSKFPYRFTTTSSPINKYSHKVAIRGPVDNGVASLLENPNQINYALKSVDILQSPKADEIFRKGDKNNWDIDKILLELNIPKEQKELIKQIQEKLINQQFLKLEKECS